MAFEPVHQNKSKEGLFVKLGKEDCQLFAKRGVGENVHTWASENVYGVFANASRLPRAESTAADMA